jgi:molybdopterin molybdotransferase
MMGLDSTLPIKSAKLIQSYKKRSKKTEFTMGNLSYEGAEYKIDFQSKKSGTSAILTNMLGNSVLVGLSEDCGDLEIGDSIDFIDLSSL